MIKLTIPPSSNWNFSRVIDCNNSGLVTYASRNDLIFIKTEATNAGRFEVPSIHTAHREKIVSVILSPDSCNYNGVATCSEDGSVTVWDLETLSPKQNHSGHQEGKRVMGLDWSHADPDLVVSISEDATVICWNLESNVIRRLPALAKISPLCLACNPHNKDIIAVGGKLGFLQIVDIKGNGRVLLHARGHTTDLVSLSWCPGVNDVVDNNGAKVATVQLLATGELGRTICIWEIGTNRKSERTLILPNSPLAGNIHRKRLSPPFICVKWIDSNKLLSSSQFGELLYWELNLQSISNINCEQQNSRINVEPEVLHDCHSKQLFAIGCPTFYRELDLKADKVGIWSVSADKFLIYYSLNSRKVENAIPTIGGVVHCLALSVCDSNRLAIGTGDNKVLVWNMYNTSKLDVTIHWNKIIGKVLSLAWHPSEEHWLACGTSFGRIVLLDVRPGKESVEFRLCHQEMVHGLHWAPPLMHKDTESTSKRKCALALFAVADGKIFQYDVHNVNKEPVQLYEALKDADFSTGHSAVLPRSAVAFKPDTTVFAVGNFDGSVHVIKCNDLSYICTIYAHRKSINCLVWHPETVASYNKISPHRNWLAVAADGIRVYDIQENTPHLIADLATHSAKVTCISWSHHFNARLVSASYDTSVQVWDVLQKTLLGTYTMHKNHVMTCLFSPFDPNLIISGSSDYTVKVWNMTEECISQPLSKVTRRSIRAAQKRGSGAQAVESVQSVSQSAGNYKSSEDIRATKNKFTFPVIGKRLHTANSFDKFYSHWLENQTGMSDAEKLCTVSIADSSKEEFTDDSESYVNFFGNREAMKNILKIEEKKLAESGSILNSQYTALWRGDLTEMIQEAIKKKRLNGWVVSVAASASYKTWKETCEAYAAQLAEEGQFLKASTYLLAVNKIVEAVDLLVEQNLFMEAVAIAKCRLPENSPVVESIFRKWGGYNNRNGLHQLAAHCYVASGKLSSAGDVLARSSDLKSLLMSALIATQAGVHDLANTRAKECLNISLQTKNWHIAETVLTKYDNLKYYKAWFEASKMVSSLKKKKKLADEVFQWLREESDGQILLESLKTLCTWSENVYTKLNEEVVKIKSFVSEKEMWHYVSGQLAIATAAFYESGAVNTNVIKHVIKALSAADDFQPTKHESAPSIQVCFWLSPKGPLSEGSIFVSSYVTEEDEELSKSLVAYLGSTICQWLCAVSDKKNVPENNDNTTVKIKTGHKNFKGFEWLIKLIETCVPYILDKDSIEYFTTKMRKQLLVQKSKIPSKEIACDVKPCKQDAKKKQRKTSKNRKCFTSEESNEISFIGTQEEVSETVCGKSVFEILKRQTIKEDVALASQENCVPCEDSFIENIKDNILIENGNADECGILQIDDTSASECYSLGIKDNSCDVDDDDKRTLENDLFVDDSKTTETIMNDDSVFDDEDIQHYECYDVFIQQFEKRRISVPNPYVAYSQLKTVISNYIEPYDSRKATILSEKCDNIWKSALQENPN